jgi:hypothetical protein
MKNNKEIFNELIAINQDLSELEENILSEIELKNVIKEMLIDLDIRINCLLYLTNRLTKTQIDRILELEQKLKDFDKFQS